MAAIANADVSINVAGDIRWTGAATTNKHTILEFIQWLMDKQDDNQAAGDDLLDITVDTPFDRSTDQIVTLNAPFNIDDTFATHLYDGSVSQTDPWVGGETLYSGLGIIGPVEAGTEYMIIQDGKVLPAFWGIGINPEPAPSLVFSRHLVKSKHGGAQIDGQRITVLARELGDQYRRFPATLGTGNAVAAIGNGADIFNTTIDATIAGWTTVINTEGFQELDIDGSGAIGQEFYSRWDKGVQTVNQTYEKTKWISQRAHVSDATTGALTGTDHVVNNATLLGIAQSFKPVGDEYLSEAIVKIKKTLNPTGVIYAELWDSNDLGADATSKPITGALARSENILASAITGTYENVIFRFNRTNPSNGVNQVVNLRMNNPEYFIAFRHADGTATDFFTLEGATDVDATQNSASDTAAVWTGVALDVNLIVNSSPQIHGIPGEQFQGINIEVGFDGEIGGTGLIEDDIIAWGSRIIYDQLDAGPFLNGEYVTFNTASNLVTGVNVIFTATTNIITRASGDFIADSYIVGDEIFISGSTTNQNDGRVGKVISLTATTLTVSGTLVTLASAAGVTISRLTGIVAGGRILHDDATSELVISLDTLNTLVDNQVISTIRGASGVIGTETTALINVTIEDADKSGGTGLLLAKDDNGVTGEVYLQVLSGNNPVDNNRMRSLTVDPLLNLAFATVTLNTRTVNPEFLGTSTGSNIIGSYGIGFDTNDVTASDLFTSLDNASRTPPNNQTFTVAGLVSGEDRVLVGPRTGALLDRGQFLLNTALTTGSETSVVVKAGTEAVGPIAADIPNVGTTVVNTSLRIQLDSGIYRRVNYSTITRAANTFNLESTGISVQQVDGVALIATGTFTSALSDFVTDGVAVGDLLVISAGADAGTFIVASITNLTTLEVTPNFSTGGTTETFTVTRGDNDWLTVNTASANQNAFVSFIDVLANASSEAYTAEFVSARNLFVRVRDGGGTPIKTFESASAQFLGTPQTVAAVRTSDA